ncbi:LemA family protein [Tautonia marina]|uniref:LemA family protein n=1 Tax=Tautonia marina TaxID=2653855 RepID=UPI00126052B5|nr:LemA family protein [Tautonia marina]
MPNGFPRFQGIFLPEPEPIMDTMLERLLPILVVSVMVGVLIWRFGGRLLGSNAEPKSGSDSDGSWLSRLLLGAAVIGLTIGAGIFSSFGIDQIRRQRDLERVPRTEVTAALTGEINLVGRAEVDPAAGVVIAPRTNTPCLYFHYTVEKKTKDSDGNTKWSTIETRDEWAPTFQLVDDSGSMTIRPAEADHFHTSNRDFTETVGDLRYREWRIEPGQRVFLFGFAQVDAEGRGSVGFTEPGHYTPMISESDEVAERRSMAVGAVFLSWMALSSLSFSVFFACWLVRLHQTPIYLALIAMLMICGLTYCGLRMMHDDLSGARNRLHRVRTSAREAVGDLLQRHRIPWDGDWSSLGRFDDSSAFASLDDRERRRLTRLRIDLARTVLRTNAIRERFPERVLAPFWGVHREPLIPLPEPDQATLAQLDREFEVARLSPGLAGIAGPVALVIALVGSWFGLKKIKEKRYIENVPTCPTSGVAVGFTEIMGTIVPTEEGKTLSGPLSERPCAQFHYTVQERRGSGKNAKWVTIEERKEQIAFLCQDDHGCLLVLPEGAEILTRHHDSRRSGKLRYSETRLEIGDPLYALGTATIEPEEMASLRLERGDDRSLPYVLSNYSESTLMHRKARVGQFWITAAVDALILPTLLLFGLLGSFQATDFLAATLVAIGYFVLAVTILLFNDLVFLRNRVRRAWHNIEVSLKKRADLVPNLQQVVQGYLSHERGAQEDLALMRQAYGGGAMLDLTHATEMLTAERSLLDRIIGLREAAPNLKGDQLTGDLMRRLTLLENEIALMRQGYNDAVERYNTRIAHIPEVLLASLFRFTEASYFHAPVDVHDAPQLDFSPGSA